MASYVEAQETLEKFGKGQRGKDSDEETDPGKEAVRKKRAEERKQRQDEARKKREAAKGGPKLGPEGKPL